MMNVLNGGAHADNSVDFQEFMVVPAGRRGLRRVPADGHRGLPRAQGHLKGKGLSTAGGDEGGFAPDLESNRAALDFLLAAIEEAGYAPGEDVAIAMDPATSELFEDGVYDLAGEGRKLSSAEMADLWHELVDRFPIVSIEDGMDEEDWDGWKLLTEKLQRPRHAARRRRPLRHQPRAPPARDRRRRRQLDPRQGQPDRDPHRDPRGDQDRPRRRLHGRHLPPLGRDRGHDHRRPRRRHLRRARSRPAPLALGPRREVQPPAADRRRAGRRADASRAPPSSTASQPPDGAGIQAACAERAGVSVQAKRIQGPRQASRAEPGPVGPGRAGGAGARPVRGDGQLPEPRREPRRRLAGTRRPARSGSSSSSSENASLTPQVERPRTR